MFLNLLKLNSLKIFPNKRMFLSHTSLSHTSFQNTAFTTTIKFNNSEKELIQIIKNFLIEKNLNTTVRIAGGWVRDKLLGLKSKNDIDFALDNMSGSEFALLFSNWYGKKENKTLNYYIVELNPEKSKHLETASMKINNFEIDFCGLRTENYTNDSRIPTIRFGTPMEDAYRRDLTINSLYYNINTDIIEDFTQRGISDLFEGKISTPLPPLVTLQDDPLRCIRIVRFANRFNFTIVPELIEACRDSSVHESLRRKVSFERIAQEIHQIMEHPSSSIRAIPLFYQLNLLQHILSIPPSHTTYRYFEKYPTTRLNWKYLCTPRYPPRIENDMKTSELMIDNFELRNLITTWVNDINKGPPLSLNSCLQFNGYVDVKKMCELSVCFNLLTHLLSNSNISKFVNTNLSDDILTRNERLQRLLLLFLFFVTFIIIFINLDILL